MSTIKSSAENLTLNADGSGNDISIQSNATEKLKLTAEGNLHLQGSDSRIQLNAQGGANTVGNNTVHVRGDAANMKLMTASGGDYIYEVNGSEKMRLKSDGKLGIGANNNDSYDTSARNLLLASSGNTGITIRSGESSNYAMIHFADGTSGQAQQRAGRILYEHSTDSLQIATANTNRLRIDSDGLKFGTDSAAANALDDYEEGTWTPVMKDTSDRALSTDTGATGAIYVKIGRQVTVTGRITTDSVGSASGQLMLTGLPFAAYGSSLGGYSVGTVGRAGNLNIASGTNIAFAVTYGQTHCEMTRWDDSVGTTDMQVSEWSADGWIMFCLVYQTA